MDVTAMLYPAMPQWKDVRALYIVGRPLPRAEEVADMAGALTGEYVAAPTSDSRGVAAQSLRRRTDAGDRAGAWDVADGAESSDRQYLD
jgi:hypothetical protein